MKITAPQRVEPGGVKRAAKAGPPDAFAVAPESDPRQAQTVAGFAPVQQVDALLALQAAPDATIGRSAAVRRAEDMLSLLDSVRAGFLSGGVPRAALERLVHAVRVQSAHANSFVDPGLQSILDDIDLRARVELAKLGFEA